MRIDDIARGSTAHVEEVEEKATGRSFARKRIVIDRPKRREKFLAVFANEVRTIRRLAGHMHFVRVYAAYATDRSFSLILEPRASDGDLAMFLDEYLQDDLTNSQKASMTSTLEQAFGCLASGLAFMHGHSIRHKDIKPGNILLHDGMVYWTDFGYATDSSSLEHSATTGAIDGGITQKYAAVEVISLGERNSKADIYSLACVFMEIYFAIVYNDVVPECAEIYVHKMDRLLQQLADQHENTQERKSHLNLIVLLINEMGLPIAKERPDAQAVCFRIFAHDHLGLGCTTCREQLPIYKKYFCKRKGSIKTQAATGHDQPAIRQACPVDRGSALPGDEDALIKGSHNAYPLHSSLSITAHDLMSRQYGSESLPRTGPSDDWLCIEEDQDYVIENTKRLPYKIMELLGHGSTAVVEQVCDRNTGQVYAKKTCIFSDMRSRHDKEEFFNNEISIIRLLKGHRHIIRLHATYVARSEIGLMLQPAADGSTLERYLHKYWESFEEPILPSSAKLVMTQALERAFGCLANGLAYIHAKGIRHRDIKPQNILIHQHSVVITDFGSSRDTAQLESDTTEGPVDFQTRMYSAPEVLNCTKRSLEADVYSLGCVFIEIFSALCQLSKWELDSEYAHIMDKIHLSIDCAQVAPRYGFLKDIIRSMTRSARSQRCATDTIYRELSQQSGFRCGQCDNSSSQAGSNQPLSFSNWQWDPSLRRYYCYILDQQKNKIGHKWDMPPQTMVMYPAASSRYASSYPTFDSFHLFLANVFDSSGPTSSSRNHGYNQQSLLLSGQPSSSNMYNEVDYEVPSEWSPSVGSTLLTAVQGYRRVLPTSHTNFYTLGRVSGNSTMFRAIEVLSDILRFSRCFGQKPPQVNLVIQAKARILRMTSWREPKQGN